jgi:hypothetical protein
MSEPISTGGPPSDIEGPPTGHVWRLTFTYHGDELQLISSERVEMLAPAPDPDTENATFRVELRDAEDLPLFTRRLHNPIRAEREVFSNDPSQPMGYVPVDEPTGAFQVIVPDLPDAAHFVLEMAEPPAAVAANEPLEIAEQQPRRRELARLRLETIQAPAASEIAP